MLFEAKLIFNPLDNEFLVCQVKSDLIEFYQVGKVTLLGHLNMVFLVNQILNL
jgi:hypothetical protein